MLRVFRSVEQWLKKKETVTAKKLIEGGRDWKQIIFHIFKLHGVNLRKYSVQKLLDSILKTMVKMGGVPQLTISHSGYLFPKMNSTIACIGLKVLAKKYVKTLPWSVW